MTEAPEIPPAAPPSPPHRSWLAPAVATGLAALLLVVLAIPGVLRYRGVPDPAVLLALEDSNRALRDEIQRLGGAQEGGVCAYDGDFYPLSVEAGSAPPDPRERLDLLPPEPAALVPDIDAVPEATEASVENIDDLLRGATVLVINIGGGGELSNGTGFFISDRQLATNAHVVGDAVSVLVTNDLIKEPLSARVVSREGGGEGAPMPQVDFALLELDEPVVSARPLTFAPARRTQTVYASGYPGFFVGEEIARYATSIVQGTPGEPLQGVVTSGIVTTIQASARGAVELDFIPHTARISAGNSGGPLIDACGRLIGINTFVSQSAGEEMFVHGDYALAAASLQRFLEAAGVIPARSEGACDGAVRLNAQAEE